jgi:large subunit ribosomal protein L7/L12
MAITKDEVVDFLKGMTLLEASELVKELEEVFGVSAAAATVAAAPAAGGGVMRLRQRKKKTRLTWF